MDRFPRHLESVDDTWAWKGVKHTRPTWYAQRGRRRGYAVGVLLLAVVVCAVLFWAGVIGGGGRVPSSWLFVRRDQAVLIQWSQAGTRVTGAYSEAGVVPPHEFRQSALKLHGRVAGGAIDVNLEGGGVHVSLCGSVSTTRLILDRVCGEKAHATLGPTQWMPGSRRTYEVAVAKMKRSLTHG